jgi:alpha-beta hydrolase superfamily lysophospholipase
MSAGGGKLMIVLCLCIGFSVITCATAPPPGVPGDILSRAGEWVDRVQAPEALRSAVLEGRVEMLPAGSRPPIPVRIYGDAGLLPPVVMTHGLQSHSGWFAQSAVHIAGLGHPVYAFDRRGSGLSESPRGDMKDYREMVEDIAVVADLAASRHGHPQFYLLGHCFGAIPATAFACAFPQRLKGLILSTPAIYTRTGIPVFQTLKIFFTPSGRRNFRIASPLDPSWFSELDAFESFIRSDDLALTDATGDFYYAVHSARRYIYKSTERIEMPVFMAIAGEDPICDNHRNIGFFETLPADDKLLVTYEDARHVLEFSPERERFFDDLAWWLTREEKAP